MHYNGYYLSIPSFTQEGESALMLAVREDETDFYRFMMSEERETRVVPQLVNAGAALDLQNKVNYTNVHVISSTNAVIIAICQVYLTVSEPLKNCHNFLILHIEF